MATSRRDAPVVADPTHVRSMPFTLRAEGDDAGDGLTLDGYAAVFDEWTDIRDWLGIYRERILRGAFTKTLKERTPIVQFNHGHDFLFGELPIGVHRSATEDDHGLNVGADIHDTWHTEPVRAAIMSTAITGMSFRFEVIADSWEYDVDGNGTDERTITEVRLFEYGPVVFPAYDTTSVALRSLRSRLSPDQLATLIGEGTAADEHLDGSRGHPIPQGRAGAEHSTTEAAGTGRTRRANGALRARAWLLDHPERKPAA